MKRFSFLLAILFSVSFLPPLLASEVTVQNLLQEAAQLKEKGSLSLAEGKFKEALALDPSNPNLHFELANLYAMRHDERKKVKDDAQAGELLVATARELGQAVMLAPDFLAAHYNLGVVYKKQGKFEQAREEFRRVLEIDPHQGNAYMQIGSTYEAQGFFDEAKEIYLKAQELDYGNVEIKAALADLEQSKEKAHERMLSETSPLGFNRFRDGFPYTGGDPANRYSEAPAGGGGIAQAVPYIGALLVQEFMKLRSKSERN